MGNCCSSREKTTVQFENKEKFILNQVIERYSEINKDNSGQLSIDCYQEIFKENPKFGKKLYYQLKGKGNDNLFDFLGPMLKDCKSNEQRFEIIMLISLNQRKQSDITYLQGLEIMTDMLLMFNMGQNYREQEGQGSKAIVESIFGRAQLFYQFYLIEDQGGIVNWKQFTMFIQDQLSGMNSLIKYYFENKFFARIYQVVNLNAHIQQQLIPQISQQSYLMNNEWIQLLYLGLPRSAITYSSKLQLLFSNEMEEYDLNKIKNILITYNLPILILISQDDQQIVDKTMVTQQNIFGAFCNETWIDNGCYLSSQDDCLFQLKPNYRLFQTNKFIQKQYYLNTKIDNMPKGIGFGQTSDNKFRVWLDQDIYNRSYVLSEDLCYQKGKLCVRKLQIKNIEIWGLSCNKQDTRGSDLLSGKSGSKNQPLIQNDVEMSHERLEDVDEDVLFNYHDLDSRQSSNKQKLDVIIEDLKESQKSQI